MQNVSRVLSRAGGWRWRVSQTHEFHIHTCNEIPFELAIDMSVRDDTFRMDFLSQKSWEFTKYYRDLLCVCAQQTWDPYRDLVMAFPFARVGVCETQAERRSGVL